MAKRHAVEKLDAEIDLFDEITMAWDRNETDRLWITVNCGGEEQRESFAIDRNYTMYDAVLDFAEKFRHCDNA